VRRVNPPEQERALLRNHGRVPERMETPEGLLKVLRRKLADQSPLAPPPSVPPAMPKDPPALPAMKAAVPAPPKVPATRSSAPAAKAPAPTVSAAPARAKPAAPPPAAVPRGNTVVQVGAFASEANARALAAKLGGQASRAGKLWRVRLGPYESRAKAAPALEKARRAGYTDARIQNAD
jgi:rare lipoprotein A